jgi:flagellar FliL protein
MSTAATATDAVAPAKSKKKLIVIVAVALLVLALGGGAALMLLKKKPVEGEDGAEEGSGKPAAAAKHDNKSVPAFVPLEPFTVNLADRDAERYAQIAITLEVEDAHLGDTIKNFMPAIRNNILMAIADRTAAEMLGREGKAKLAETIRRETSRALGYEIEDEEAAADAEEKPAKNAKKKKKKAAQTLPVKAVHFSNFIIQ